MKLLTKEILSQFEKQGYTDGKPKEDIKVILKLFNPCGAGTWYLTEYDPVERMFFGFVNLGDPQMAELGYVSLDEIERVKGPLGIGIERDRYFGYDHSLKEVMEIVKNGLHI